jgi:hypothetical protein
MNNFIKETKVFCLKENEFKIFKVIDDKHLYKVFYKVRDRFGYKFFDKTTKQLI